MRGVPGVLPIIDNRAIQTETAALPGRLGSHIPPKVRPALRLSGGQRQAATIARAIYWKAKVVLMDEPTAALGAGVINGLGGAALFAAMSNGAALMDIDPCWKMVPEGLLIALVVHLDNRQKRRLNGT